MLERLKATGGTRQQIDREEAARALRLLVDPEQGCEVFCLPYCRSRTTRGGDVPGILATLDSMVDSAHIFYRINPVPVEMGATAAKNTDIVRRRWFMIDIDPKRPPKTCATVEERDAAKAVMLAVRRHLQGRGWPAPIVVCSGNGWHLFYRIDLDNDIDSKELLRAIWKRLDARFTTLQVKIEPGIHKADQLARIPGTWNMKGDGAEPRPHRQAFVFDVPDTLLQVGRELLALAAAPAHDAETVVDVPKKLGKLKATSGGSNGTAYGKKAIEDEVAKLASCPAGGGDTGGRNNQLNASAFNLGQLVAGGVLTEAEVIDALRDAARACGLDEDDGGPGGVEATIRSGLEAGKTHPRSVPERNGTHGGAAAKKVKAPEAEEAEGPTWTVDVDEEIVAEGKPEDVIGPAPWQALPSMNRHFHLTTLGALLLKEFPPPNWIIPGILSEGLNILAGAPKQGKSMLALNLAMTIAGGGLALGKHPVDMADVIYLSLEDKQRRVKARAFKMLKQIARDNPALAQKIGDHLTITTEWPRQHEGGLQMLRHWRDHAKKPGFVIIDTWARFAPPPAKHGNAYVSDSDALGELKHFSDWFSLSSMPVMHTRKPSAGSTPSDFVQEITGTLGLAGTADGLMGLLRSNRQDDQATFAITGRDVGEQELILKFDLETLTWTSLGSKEEHVGGEVQRAVVAYLKGLGGAGAFAKTIAEAIDQDPGCVRMACARLFAKRIICRVGISAWGYPGEASIDGEASATDDPFADAP